VRACVGEAVPVRCDDDRSGGGLGMVFDGLGFLESEEDQGLGRGDGFSTVYKPQELLVPLHPMIGARGEKVSPRGPSGLGRDDGWGGATDDFLNSGVFRNLPEVTEAEQKM
jgi:hypothetical protein